MSRFLGRIALLASAAAIGAAHARAQEAPPDPPAAAIDPEAHAAPWPERLSPLDDAPLRFVPRRPRTVTELERLNAIRTYLAARALERNDDWLEAIETLEQARRIDPKSVEIQRRLSRLYFALGRTDEAVQAARESLAADPDDGETLRRLVRYYLQSNQPDRAEADLKAVLANKKLDERSIGRLIAWHDLGMIFFESERYADAVEPLSSLVTVLEDRSSNRLTSDQIEEILGEDEASAFRRFGEAFFNAGRYDRAIAAFRRSRSIDTENLQTPLFLSQSLLKAGQPEQALAELEPTLDQKPPGRVAYDILAQVLVALNREDEVLPRLEKAREADPGNSLLLYALAERYKTGGQVDRAAELYRKLIETQPDPQGFGTLSMALLGDKKYDELLQLLETVSSQPNGQALLTPQAELLATDPEAAAGLVAAGIKQLEADPPRLGPASRQVLQFVAAQTGLDEERITLDRAGLKQNPSRGAYIELATTLSDTGRHEEAAATLREMIEKYPQLGNAPQVLVDLGFNELQAGKLDAALESARKAVGINPDDLSALELIGLSLNRLGKWDEAIAHYEALLKRAVNNEDLTRVARVGLSNVYIARNEPEKAEAELEALLAQMPNDAWINNDLGYLYAERGKKLDEAEQMIRKAVAQEPTNGSYLDSLGWVLYRKGELDKAAEYLEKAAQIKKSDPTILDHLGDVYYRMKSFDRARESWQKAEQQASRSTPPDKVLAEVRKKLEALGQIGADGEDGRERPEPAPPPNP